MDKEAMLKDFIAESREHLADIEADLLSIEACGAEIDRELVNKVFRAAHTIKGGSGFLGFEKIKSLAHGTETVLDLLRNRRIVPGAEVVNALLAAFDRLKDMVNNVQECDALDIDDLLKRLTGLTAAPSPPAVQNGSVHAAAADTPELSAESPLSCPERDRIARSGMYAYRVIIDLVRDIEEKGLTLQSVLEGQLGEKCEILDCAVEEPEGDFKPVQLVIATVMSPDDFAGLFPDIEKNRITLLVDPQGASPGGSDFEDGATARSDSLSSTDAMPPDTASGSPNQGDDGPVQASPPVFSSSENADKTLRVNVNLLEMLMNLAGELVLSRNQLRTAVARDNRELLSSADQRINQVTSELQDVIMETRLQPIGNVFAKFPRVVRDMSQSLGKKIQLDIGGREVALDKTVIEGIADPLIHMVRNSVDHGIETPAERTRAGKSASGTIRIEAYYEAGQVVVEIADDGKGIDPVRVAESALSKGLITEDKLQGFTDRDKQALIMLPGLSTAGTVSDVSGRGVGMDVVKTNIDRLGGQMDLFSKVGDGTTFRIKLPLTLAIIPSLIISEGDQKFAIPQSNIEELLRLRPEQVETSIEVVGDTDVILLRDRMLPLVRFADVLGIDRTYSDPDTGSLKSDRRENVADRRSARHTPSGPAPDASAGQESCLRTRTDGDRRRSEASVMEIAVVTTGTLSFGLVVKQFHDTEEVVVKPLGSRLKGLREYSGATILGDGSVALILDIGGFAAKAGVVSVSGTARAAELSTQPDTGRASDVHTLLVFHNPPDERCAIPLDLVLRIERISAGQIEVKGGRRAMQYRGGSLPLVTLSDVADMGSLDGDTGLVVLISSVNSREVGLLGTMPVDVVQTYADIDQSTHRQKGISGSAVIDRQTVLLADIYEIVDELYPEWSAQRVKARSSAPAAEAATVLLAEDSDFFRSQVKRYFEEEGFTVIEASDGEQAWDLLTRHLDSVNVVVTDVEMPRLSGLGLTYRIRSDERTGKLPVIALTSLAGDEDVARGIEAGVNEYQVKLDRDKLVASVHQMLGKGVRGTTGVRSQNKK